MVWRGYGVHWVMFRINAGSGTMTGSESAVTAPLSQWALFVGPEIFVPLIFLNHLNYDT